MRRLAFLALAVVACTRTPVASNDARPRVLSTAQQRVASVVFPEDPDRATPCASRTQRSFIECLLRERLASDEPAVSLALRLYDELGIVVGVDTEKVMEDDSYRGPIHVVPALPIGEARVHMRFVLDALHRLDRVLDELARRAQRSMAFVRAPKALRFFRTVNGRTPSAYATEGEIAYNLDGELWTDTASVEDTLVHELFHLGDEADHWSESVLTSVFDRIRGACGTDASCLEPYAPFDTRVDGDMYYAFHPKSDVREYGGELAIRFVREQRQWLDAGRASTPFKCVRPENAVVWNAFAERFFGSVDLVPPCA